MFHSMSPSIRWIYLSTRSTGTIGRRWSNPDIRSTKDSIGADEKWAAGPNRFSPPITLWAEPRMCSPRITSRWARATKRTSTLLFRRRRGIKRRRTACSNGSSSSSTEQRVSSCATSPTTPSTTSTFRRVVKLCLTNRLTRPTAIVAPRVW
uniref:Uncharacterized protein n=1 Tax=Cacopsylla melanoneura TaxID=428564 RepID=A0A8D8YCQ2_9HEMI